MWSFISKWSSLFNKHVLLYADKPTPDRQTDSQTEWLLSILSQTLFGEYKMNGKKPYHNFFHMTVIRKPFKLTLKASFWPSNIAFVQWIGIIMITENTSKFPDDFFGYYIIIIYLDTFMEMWTVFNLHFTHSYHFNTNNIYRTIHISNSALNYSDIHNIFCKQIKWHHKLKQIYSKRVIFYPVFYIPYRMLKTIFACFVVVVLKWSHRHENMCVT